MPRFLGLALVAEGATDQRFLRPLLRRLAERLCAESGRGVVEISDLLELSPARDETDANHRARIHGEAVRAYQAWHVLFVHTDGAGDPAAAESERIDPIRDALGREAGAASRRVVGVVPVREMEAWAIADGDAVRRAFGTTRDDATLGLPRRPADSEKVEDPKMVLESALQVARGGRRGRRGRKAAAFLDLIAEHVDLDVLDQLPAFSRLRRNLAGALRNLGFIEGARC